MGNNNSSGNSRKRRKSGRHPSPDGNQANQVTIETVPSSKPRKTRRNDRCVNDNFVIHGIDFLPESAKKKERRKKNVPKFLQFDEPLWLNNRLNFMARIQNAIGHSNGTLSIKPAEKESKVLESDVTSPNPRMMRSQTACAGFSDEKLLDWKSYKDYPFRNIVMSGGGSKGYAYIGSLKALEDCGILRNVTKVAGSSAGAICAGLLAVGCSPQEIADVFKCDIKWLFHDQSCACCCCLPRVCNKFGIHPAKRFHETYGEHLKKKVGNPDITFLQLKNTWERELCIVVTNLSRMCPEYFNYKTTPHLPIRDAVRMSMAFPVVFRAVRYKLDGRECVFTDGGLLDQYPVHCFDDDTSCYSNNHHIDVDGNNDNSTNDDLPNMATLGLYVVSEKPIDHKIWQALFGKEIPCKPTYLPNTKLARERLEKEMSKRKMHNKKFDKQEFMDELCSSVGDGAKQVLDHYEIWNKSHVDITNFGEYFVATLETLLISQRKLRIKSNDSLRTIPINCGYIGTNDYVIEPGDREFMIDQGYTGTVRYLREFIASKNASASLCKRKVPRSRSTNLADQCQIRGMESTIEGNEAISAGIRYNLQPTSGGYNLPEDDIDRGSTPPRCRHCSRNSSDEEMGRNIFRLHAKNYLQYDDEALEMTKVTTETPHANDCPDERQKESYDVALMSVSSESEAYGDLVSRIISALDQAEQVPILESRV